MVDITSSVNNFLVLLLYDIVLYTVSYDSFSVHAPPFAYLLPFPEDISYHT